MVDWDLAVSLGSRVAGDGPRVTPCRGRRGRGRAARRAPTGPRGLVREFTGLVAERADRARPGRRPAGLDPGQRRQLRHRCSDRSSSKLAAKKGRPPALAEHGRLQDHRRRGRRPARLPGRQGARPVRPVLRGPASGPAAAGRPQHRARRARARRADPTTSGSGSACTRRPTGCSSPRCRGCATTSTARCSASPRRCEPTRLLDDAASSASATPVRGGGDAQPDGRHRHPGAEGDRRARHRRDVACSRGTPTWSWTASGPSVIPTVADIRRSFDRRRKGVGAARPACCAGCSGSTPRWRSTATARRSCAAWWTRSACTSSTPCGTRPENLPTKAEIGEPGGLGLPGAVSLHPAVAAVRLGVRRCLADLEPGSTVVVACSGGADSLALLAATVFEARRPARCGWSARPSTTGCSRARPTTPGTWSPRWRRWGRTRR